MIVVEVTDEKRNGDGDGLRSAMACTARSISFLKSPMTSSSWLESRSGPSNRSRRGTELRRTGLLEIVDLGPGAVTVAEHVAKALGDEQTTRASRSFSMALVATVVPWKNSSTSPGDRPARCSAVSIAAITPSD